MRRCLGFLSCGVLFFSVTALSGCVVVHEEHPKGGPPPWAPAHNYRASHTYYYYPDEAVYHDVRGQRYFYLSAGRWVNSPALPPGIRIEGRRYYVLEMDTDTPYVYHGEVARRYPRETLKKQQRREDSDRGAGEDKN